jgi:hypothetical protein
MTFFVAAIGAFLLAIGVVGVVSPVALAGFVSRWQTPNGLHLAAGIRVVVGIALLVAAGESRAPAFLRILGWVSIATGALTPLMGLRRFEALLAWWKGQPAPFRRAWAALAAGLGAAIAWSVLPGSAG